MKKLHKTFLILSVICLTILNSSTTPYKVLSSDQFSLSNNTYFSPGSEVFVNLHNYTSKKSLFIFRLLRITKPVEFFFKCQLQNFNNNFDVLSENKDYLLQYTELVKEWKERYSGSGYYSGNAVNIGKINRPGFYILQAFKRNQVAYCGISVSDLGLIYKYTDNQLLAFVSNSKTSEFIKNCNIDLYRNNQLLDRKRTDKDGIAIFKSNEPLSSFDRNSTFIIAQTDSEVVLSDPYFYFYGKNKYTAYVYTSQPVYRPGQEVFFKAIIKNMTGRDIINVVNENFSVTVKSDNNKEVYSSSFSTNQYGSVSGNFILAKDAELGTYTIELTKENIKCYGAFTVEEYKKPEFEIIILTNKESYKPGDFIEGKISAKYYFGFPLKEGKVKLNIYKSTYWKPWWYGSEYSWFYKDYYSYENYDFEDHTLLGQFEGEFDENGEYNFSYLTDDESDGDFIYTISAEVYDNSRRTVYGNRDIYVARGEFTISTSPEKHFFENGEKVNLRINISTLANKPVETDFTVLINYSGNSKPNIIYKEYENEITLPGRTDNSGMASIELFPSNLKHGYYSYTIMAEDEDGEEITSQSYFYYGDSKYQFIKSAPFPEIVTDKDFYDVGDSLIAYIFLPQSNVELLLTYERNDFIKYQRLKTYNNRIIIREKLNEIYSPSIDISIAYFYDKKLYTQSKKIGILNKKNLLDVEIRPSKDTYQPGENAEYNIKVTDGNGLPVQNAELSIGVIDEGIYAIREDREDDIQTFFNTLLQTRAGVNHSLFNKQITGSSRIATSEERNYFGSLERLGFGVCYFSGYIKIPLEDSTQYSIVLLNEDNLYSTEVNKDGYYEFALIDEGEYDLYVADGSSLALVGKISTYIKKYNFDLNEIQNKFIKDSIYDESGETKDILILEKRFFVQRSTNSVRVIDSEEITRLPIRGVENLQNEIDKDYLEARLRSNFVDAAFWSAHITTDSLGLAVVKFQLPDNITSWRTTARAITVDSRSGQQLNKVVSKKDLLVRMETPRFFREGDELTISTIVHNYLDENKKTKISFEVENLDLVVSRINSKSFNDEEDSFRQIEDNSYEIIINKNSELRIDWIVKVNIPSGEAKLTAKALTDKESDAVELKVPILPKGFKEIIPFALESSANTPEEINIEIPGDVDLNSVKLSFSMSPSIAGTILTALDDLVGYPYGCVEQTMSRFLPSILVANTFKESNVPLKAKTIDELPKMVEAGLDKLYGYQHSDGGWGWWNYDATHPYMTAYVVYGLCLARTAGYKVREKVFNAALENLAKQIVNFTIKSSEDETTLAYMLFTYSTAMKTIGKQDETFINIVKDLFQRELNPYSLSLLAISSVNFNQTEICFEYISKLKTLVNEDNYYAFWDEENINYRWQKDRVQSTAFALSAILKCYDDKQLTKKIVHWLLTQKKGFSWRSTQETAVVIFALAEYLKSNLELNPDYKAEIFINDKLVMEEHFTKDDVYLEQKTFVLTETNKEVFKNGKNKIRIVKQGNGKIYFSGLIQYFTKLETSNMTLQKFKIERTYYLLLPEERDGRLLYVKKDFNGRVKSGENIFVKTHVKCDEANLEYFILEDLLPSGFEPVKDDRYFEIEGEEYYNYDDSYSNNWRWFYSDKDTRRKG